MSNAAPLPAAATTPRVVRTVAELKDAVRGRLEEGAVSGSVRRLALVPTMGALHDGHARLVRTAAAENDVVVVTVFVNELQFNDREDFLRYPRTLEADVELLAGAGADLVFAPEEGEVYPDGAPLVKLDSGRLGEKFEGEARPGHFDGMLAVVSKLLHYGQPPLSTAVPVAYRAYFGQKDAQQLAIIRRMVADLNYDVDIRSVAIVRSPEGLALSSRNRFLSAEEAEAALVLSRALFLLKRRADASEPLHVEEAEAMIASQPLVKLDYFEVVEPRTLEPLAFNCLETPFTGEALALIAARVGPVRLIDNMPLGQ